MRLIVLTPGIKKTADLKGMPDREPGDVVYMTNPLFQQKISHWAPALSVVDDDLSNCDADFQRIVEQAERYSREWASLTEVKSTLLYRDINLGTLLTRDLTYYFVALLSSLYLYDKLFNRFSPREVWVADDGSVWGGAICWAAAERGIPVIHQKIPIRPAALAVKPLPKRVIEPVLRVFNQFQISLARQGGILFSCAFKFSEPFMARTHGNYFLRDSFSISAFRDGWRYGFTHAVPADFPKPRLLSLKKVFDESASYMAIDAYFTGHPFFLENGKNLWELARPFFETLLLREMPVAVSRVNAFLSILEKFKPRSVVVDEDVLPFNKTLLVCANKLGIPTFTMIHGIPYKKTGTLPSVASRILAWGSSTQERLVSWGLPQDKVLSVGAPQFEGYGRMDEGSCRSLAEKYFNIAPGQKILLYTVPTLYTNERAFPQYSRTSVYATILKDTLCLLYQYLEERPDTHLIVKFHPAERNSWYAKELVGGFAEEVRSRAHFVQKYSAPSLILASNLVLTVASTVYFESILLKKAVMIFDYSDRRYCRFMSEDFLDILDRPASFALMDRILSREEDQRMLQKHHAELSRHFYGENKKSVQNALNALNGKYAYSGR